MSEFAARTGLSPVSAEPRRYLWTDAFAVANYLTLFESTGNEADLELALRLIGQVHATLGRHRSDDARSGWISGLDEDEGRRHPTAGGLRIGKPVNERAAGQPIDDRDEWDRDGQYFHYLTKWMQALARAAVVTSDPNCCRWAIELAKAAHAAFTYRASADGPLRMAWKMSIDLTRPLVPSMGHHDPLDALVSYCTLEDCRRRYFADTDTDTDVDVDADADADGETHDDAEATAGADLPDLQAEIEDAAAMCVGRDWVTEDPLGIGGLLVDVGRIVQLLIHGKTVPGISIAGLLTDARIGLTGFVRRYPLDAPAEQRLAFRELGLAIGLHAAAALHQAYTEDAIALPADAANELGRIVNGAALADQIEPFWRQPDNQSNETWVDHIDINSVMLASSLLARRRYCHVNW